MYRISRPQVILSIAIFLVCIDSEIYGDEVRFNEQIRPILSDRCFACHGPDASKRRADFRLDVYDEAVVSGAISPGDSSSSPILERLLTEDPDLQMPPPSSKLPRLSKTEIELVRQWIDEGAEYEKHWSFLSLDFEQISDQASRDPIDFYVKSGLELRGLRMQQTADRRTLARRAAFDVTGLPPNTAQVEEFVNDSSDRAWERYIDRLLESTLYGERMAVDWLDVSRYADSYGFQVDRERPMWPWRDWVIRCFNENKPFDEFIVEQLAGDLLPNATKEQILATAFNRLHQQESEGGSVEEEYRVEYVADRVQTYATAFLGLTFECARCHDHKYDPIQQKEFYGLFAMFQNIDEAGLYSYFTESPPTPALDLTDDKQDQKLRELTADVERLEMAFEEHVRGLRESTEPTDAAYQLPSEFRLPILRLDFDAMLDQKIANLAAQDQPATVTGENRLVESRSGMAMQFTGDDPVKTTQGNFLRHDPFSVALWLQTPDHKDRAVVFHRSRAWTDAASRGYELLIEEGKLKWSLIHFWPGNAASIRTVHNLPVQQWTHVVVTYDGSSRANGLSIYVNGELEETEIVRDSLSKTIAGGGYEHIDLGERFRDRGLRDGKIDDFQVFPVALTAWETILLFRPEMAGGELHRSAEPNASQTAMQREHRIEQNVRTRELREQLRVAREKLFTLQDSFFDIMVMRELPQPKPAYLLLRGEYQLRDVQVPATTPAELSPFPADQPKNRLGLARWTVAKDHPLTARVTVNRVWQSIFGRGLVKTSEDFGSQGTKPVYQNVLDSLAVRFIESGWNMKSLVKTILMSQTYQQQSVSVDTTLMADDPENDLLARGPRFRLSAEMIRDNALAVSGLIDLTMGGVPVNPYEMSESFKSAKPTDGSGVYRRSIYTNWRRTGPPPAMLAFDAPRRAVCTPKRERTASPLQALILLNGTQYVEAARALATKTLEMNPHDIPTAITSVFQNCLGRVPDEMELEICNRLLDEQRAYFQASPDRAKEYLTVGRLPSDGFLPVEELASMTVLCQIIMNHDECVVKR